MTLFLQTRSCTKTKIYLRILRCIFSKFYRRAGQTVSADEQLNLTVDMEESISAASSVANMKAFDRPTAQLSLASSHISLEDRTKLEEERERMYQLLDAKDDEIQEQSQLVEKLKEQMLEQEELIASSRRDYENLTKEMSKIQVKLNFHLKILILNFPAKNFKEKCKHTFRLTAKNSP